MTLQFEATITNIKDTCIVRIPSLISAELPSRGMVMVQAIVRGISILVPLEPDGNKGHWMEVTKTLLDELACSVGDRIEIEMEPADTWEEPEMPADIINAISAAGLEDTWQTITTKAKWEWLRWIRSTNNAATRQKRISVACSKLSHGEKRPCCFDQTRCTVPEVAKTGVLLDVL